MNIAIVNPEYPTPTGRDHGGIATFIYNLANALAAKGHGVHVLLRENVGCDPLDRRVEVHQFDHRSARPPLPHERLFGDSAVLREQRCSRAVHRRLLEIHANSPIDIVEIPEYNGLASEVAGRVPFPVVVHFHTPTSVVDALNQVEPGKRRRRFYRFERDSLRQVASCKSTSASLRALLPEHMGLPTHAVEVIRNPMPTWAFDAIEKEHTAHGNRFDLLFSGRLEKRKGAEILLNSIRDIMALDPRIHLTVAGETLVGQSQTYRTAMENALDREDRKRLWFLGALGRRELIALYCRSTAFLMPSLFDNAPNSLFEAMAAQLPVIAANVGGVNEVITHERNGLLFSIDSGGDLLTCIRRFLESPELRDQCAGNAYRDAVTVYSPARIATETVAYYERVRERWVT